MQSPFSYYDTVTVSAQYTTNDLYVGLVPQELIISNMSIVPQTGGASDVTVKLIRGTITVVILDESLAAGDKIYDFTVRNLIPSDQLRVECTNPVDITINGSWF